MKIITAKKAGFCSGVLQAVEKARRTAAQNPGSPVYTPGPLVHNPRVVRELEDQGVHPLENLKGTPPGILVIRSHGVTAELIEEAEKAEFTLVDATCPLVARIHRIAARLDREGYHVIIVGHRNHPEVEGIRSRVKGRCTVVETLEQVEALSCEESLGVVAQTTALLTLYREASCRLQEKAFEVRTFNTICPATAHRQAAAAQLAPKVDVMVIIGGKNSSNTRRLLEVCLSANPRSHHVESASEIKNEWFEGAQKAGVTAGASTPPEDIDEVIARLKKIN